MTTRIAINGFGRIGRNVLRAFIETTNHTNDITKGIAKDIDIVAVNATASVADCAHLLRYDSIHGRLAETITVKGEGLAIGGRGDSGKVIPFTSSRVIADLDWAAHKADIVLECTGAFNTREAAAAHLQQGAKRVLVSAPCKEADFTAVYGVNHQHLKPAHTIVSNASCTTNCFAPLAQVLDEAVGIEVGFMTTIHSYTSDQRILDNRHKDLYRGRGAATNIVPTTTGAARAVEMVLPQLKGRLDGVAMRVPTPNVSVVDFTFTSRQPTSSQALNAALQKAAKTTALNGVLAVTDEPLVSSDFNHDPHSAVVHLDQTRVVGERFCRTLAWYDNEWGFCMRMLDMAQVMGQQL